MITKQDIIDRATEWQLRAEVVEKDYILGWLLAALSVHDDIQDSWIFKGGTCIKKCFFETYRFSEDLDFSLLPDAAYSDFEIRDNLLELTRTAHELSGIDFPEEFVEVKPRKNKQGQPTFQGKVGYRGPLGFPGRRSFSTLRSMNRSSMHRAGKRFFIHTPMRSQNSLV